MLVQIVLDICSSYGSLPVILTGGVFQNRTLLELLIKSLRSRGIRYYYSKKVPLNDGGIAIGQIYSQT